LVLAIDTSTRRGSVALRSDGELLGETRRDLEGGHSIWLLGAVEELLARSGLGAPALEGLAVVTGPGSFTGLRVGIATVQGLALPRGTPCLGVSTLDALAWQVRGSAPRILAVMDAWRGELYVGEYDAEGRPVGPAAVETPEALLGRIASEPCAVFGDGALEHRETIAAACPQTLFSERSLYLAAALAELAEGRLERGEGRPAADLRAVYLRPAVRSERR
jgi:tRNA threonylcarbamoyladenosine biosynthesis protein TsaB